MMFVEIGYTDCDPEDPDESARTHGCRCDEAGSGIWGFRECRRGRTGDKVLQLPGIGHMTKDCAIPKGKGKGDEGKGQYGKGYGPKGYGKGQGSYKGYDLKGYGQGVKEQDFRAGFGRVGSLAILLAIAEGLEKFRKGIRLEITNNAVWRLEE